MSCVMTFRDTILRQTVSHNVIHYVTLYWKHWVWHCLIAALVTIGAAERQNIFTVKSAVRLNGSNKKDTQRTLWQKNTHLKWWAQVNIAKRYGLIWLQLQCVFILLDILYKLDDGEKWQLEVWQGVHRHVVCILLTQALEALQSWTRRTMECISPAQEDRSPTKTTSEGLPLCLPQTLYYAPLVRQIREN